MSEGVVEANGTKRANPFLLGADPEFCLIERTTGKALWDLRGVYNMSEDSQIGRDCGNLVELRPKPAYTAYELVARLKSLIESPVLEPASPYLWKAGAVATYRRPDEIPARDRTLTMGGHVHFETKLFPVEETVKYIHDAYAGRDIPVKNKSYPAAGALNALTTLLIHLDILPQTESVSRLRSSSIYGSESDAIRISKVSYEYRRMCSWLFHPRVSFVALTCSKLCVVDYQAAELILKNATSFDALKKLVEVFASKDDDAARLHEKIFPRGLERVQADCTIDFKPAWKRWNPQGVVLT